MTANPHFRTFPIPCERGHDVVYGLARGPGREIYLAPSNEFAPGLCAAVYSFNPDTERFREVIDIRQATGFDAAQGLMPHSKIHLCLQSTSDGRAFAATHFTAPAVGQTSFDALVAFRGRYPGAFLLEYDPAEDRVINHGLLTPGEGARISCLDERNSQYYFLSYPRNHLFRYDYAKRRLYDLGRMGQENSFGLEVDAEGNVYTSDDLGRFWRYSFVRDRLEALDLHVPLAPGRSPKGNYIRRMVLAGDGCLYGCGNKGVRFFRLDPRGLTLDDLGTLVGGERLGTGGYPQLPPAKALAAQDDGSLLIAFGGDGIYPGPEPVPRLFRFEAGPRRTTDLGPFACGTDGLPAWIPQCAVATGPGGPVYFGLQQTVGQLRLWRYEPIATVLPNPSHPIDDWTGHRSAVARQPFGASIEGSAPLPFIRTGRAQLHELGWLGEDRVIPPEESAIGGLVFGSARTLYGVTFGRRCHLFSYLPYQQNRFTENFEVHPWDLGVVGEGPATGARLFADVVHQRLILAIQRDGAVEFWSYPIGAEARAYRGIYHSVPHGPPVNWSALPWVRTGSLPGLSVQFESLSYQPSEGRFYAVDPSGKLISAGIAGDIDDLAALDKLPPLTRLQAAPGGHLWAATRQGKIIRVQRSPSGQTTVADAGHLLEGVTSLALSSAGRLAVGGIDGRISIVDADARGISESQTLRRRVPVRALAWHQNESVWGFAGADQDIGEAFCLRQTGLEELGILQVPSTPRYWMVHRCQAITVGPEGDAYFGEADRISHLLRLA